MAFLIYHLTCSYCNIISIVLHNYNDSRSRVIMKKHVLREEEFYMASKKMLIFYDSGI